MIMCTNCNGKGCMYCCERCKYDEHICLVCGKGNLYHGEKCLECEHECTPEKHKKNTITCTRCDIEFIESLELLCREYGIIKHDERAFDFDVEFDTLADYPQKHEISFYVE